MSRTRNSAKNIAYAIILQAVNTVLNFTIRSMMIHYLGMEVVSLNGLFTEVLAALSLAELGVGTAIVYNLYKPLADGDNEKVCALMGLFRTAYRIIAIVTLVIGVAITPFLDFFINEIDYPDSYVRIIYLLFVFNLSLSYAWSYKISLINADQKGYVLSRFNTVFSVGTALIKIGIMAITKNYVVFLAFIISTTVIGNIFRSYLVDRQYPWLKGHYGQVSKDERKEVFSNIRNIFIKSLSGKITNSTDNILISTLINTLLVGIYSNYALVLGVFKQISNEIAYSGIGASLGNLLATEDNSTCKRVIDRIVYIFFIIASVGSVGIFTAIQPFIILFTKSHEYMLETNTIFIMCMCLFIEIVNRPLWSVMEVSGLFKYDKYASIAGSIVNLIISIVLGLKIGISGIFIGTFLTWVIQGLIKAYLLYTMRLNDSPINYYVKIVVMLVAVTVQMYVSFSISNMIHVENTFVQFFINGLLAVIISAGSIFIFTYKTEEFKYVKGLFLAFCKRKKI